MVATSITDPRGVVREHSCSLAGGSTPTESPRQASRLREERGAKRRRARSNRGAGGAGTRAPCRSRSRLPLPLEYAICDWASRGVRYLPCGRPASGRYGLCCLRDNVPAGWDAAVRRPLPSLGYKTAGVTVVSVFLSLNLYIKSSPRALRRHQPGPQATWTGLALPPPLVCLLSSNDPAKRGALPFLQWLRRTCTPSASARVNRIPTKPVTSRMSSTRRVWQSARLLTSTAMFRPLRNTDMSTEGQYSSAFSAHQFSIPVFMTILRFSFIKMSLSLANSSPG